MTLHKPNFFVLTGGPGVGKTTLLEHLRAAGERVVPENARAVIAEQTAAGGRGVPWLDNDLFVELTTGRDVAAFDALAAEPDRVFFDRGIMDMRGCNGAAPTAALIEAIRTRRYNRKVFVLPPWREIYAPDAERRQDWPEAEATFARVLSNLAECGYEAVIVPKASVAERADFVLARVNAWRRAL